MNFLCVLASLFAAATSVSASARFPIPQPMARAGPIGDSSASGVSLHPDGDLTKCVGVAAGIYANGSAVDIFDCIESATQKWVFTGVGNSQLQSTNPVDGSTWCLDSGRQSTWVNGLKLKVWQCFANLPQQTWTPINTAGTVKLAAANFCLDLTNGDETDRNILQIWTCGAGNPNQFWTTTPA